MDGACCTRADPGSIFLKRGGHACKMEKSNTSPRPESGGGGGGGGGGGMLCILPLSTLLQGHFYLLCTVMVIAIWFRSWGDDPPPLTTALMSAVLAPHQRDALCFCYLSDCSFSIKKQLMRS